MDGLYPITDCEYILNGPIILYDGRDSGNRKEDLVPDELWALLDTTCEENNLFFLSEEDLHYFISQNVGEDLVHSEAKARRRNRNNFVKRRILFTNYNKTKIKDLKRIKIGSRGLYEMSQLNTIVRVPYRRLKEQQEEGK